MPRTRMRCVLRGDASSGEMLERLVRDCPVAPPPPPPPPLLLLLLLFCSPLLPLAVGGGMRVGAETRMSPF